MDLENILDELLSDPVSFTTMLCYRSYSEIDMDILSQTGSVIVLSKNKMQGQLPVWRALYDVAIESDTMVLSATPSKPAAQGMIGSIKDEIARSQLDRSQWGIERMTRNEIEFDNGSRIKSVAIGEHIQNAPDNIRGYAPDLLIVNDWTGQDKQIPQETKEDVLAPMTTVTETDLWINATDVQDDKIFDAAYRNGAFVKKLDL